MTVYVATWGVGFQKYSPSRVLLFGLAFGHSTIEFQFFHLGATHRSPPNRWLARAFSQLYIHTPEPPAPGTFIQLLLDVPAGEVRARAVVQRSKSKEGMGVKFVAMQQEDRARFVRWLKHLSS
jgi:hypothetical protein